MEGTASKRQLIRDTVRRRIASGDFRPGDRIPSDSEFVREFGVSRPTVAKALQDLEQAGLVKRKTGSGTYVLKVSDDGGLHFGLLIPGLGTTEIFEPICSEMARVAQQMGHSLLWGSNSTSNGTPVDKCEQVLALSQHYIDTGVGGVFFAPLEHVEGNETVNRQVIQGLHEASIPVVLLDRDYIPYPERSQHDLVGIDNRRIGYTITHHLFQQGCQRVVFVARPSSAATIDARIAGFTEAVVNDSGFFDKSLVWRCDPRDHETIGRYVSELRPQGIVCGNDITAGYLMHALDKLGLDVPEDVMVVGTDDVKYAELLRVPLTTIRQPCSAIGDAAIRAMVERVEYPQAPARDILLGCELIERASTLKATE